MAVDQARQDDGVSKVHDIALRRVADEAVAHFDDLVPCDHESFIALKTPFDGSAGNLSVSTNIVVSWDEISAPVGLCRASALMADAISAANVIPKRFAVFVPRHVGRKNAPQGSGCFGRNQLKQTRLKTNRNEGVACGYRDEG